ncbi:9920_t:CDS:2, partial [Ambispora leptoticha]
TAQSSSSSSRPISVLSAQNVPRTPQTDMNLPSQAPLTTAPTVSINKDAIQQQNPPDIDDFLCSNNSLAQVLVKKMHERLQIFIIGAKVLNDVAEADVPDGEPHQQGNARSQSSKKRKHTEMEDSGIEGSLIFEKAPSETLDQRLFAKKETADPRKEDCPNSRKHLAHSQDMANFV